MPTTIAITADKGIPKSMLERLSKQTSLPLLTPQINADYHLHLSQEHLELQRITVNKNPKKKSHIESIFIDFLAGKANYRRLHGGGKGQDIAKAVGLHKIANPTILDLTAGMGGDAFVLASLGVNVTMIERNRVVHALLKDALERAGLSSDREIQNILERLSLINQNGVDYLNNLEEGVLPDVIYLDPMFPGRSKSAQVKKEMTFFHDIVGQDDDGEELLFKALELARKRIVVKRPRLAEPLTSEIKVSFEISGKSTRYDVYLPVKP